MKNFPKQRLSFKEKTKDDYQWCKDVVDSLLLNAPGDLEYDSSGFSSYEKKLSNYQLYNNILNQRDFEKECNPMGLEVGQFRDEIQPYNKTYNKIQVLLGEELRRPFNYKVVLTNPDGIKSKLAHKDDMLRNYIYSVIQQTLEEFQLSPEEPLFDPSTLIDPSELDSYMSTSYLSSKEILASKLLQYLTRSLSLKDLKNDAFKHGLISGEEIIYVGKFNNEPHVEVLNSLGVFYHKSPETKYIQDGLFAGYRTFMSAGDILDKFDLKPEDQDRIDTYHASFHGRNRTDTINSTMKYFHDDHYYDTYNSAVRHEGSYANESHFTED